jgi:hypothetical protein
MAGGIVLAVVMLLLLPVIFFTTGAFFAVLGWFLKSDAEARHEGSEFISLNR